MLANNSTFPPQTRKGDFLDLSMFLCVLKFPPRTRKFLREKCCFGYKELQRSVMAAGHALSSSPKSNKFLVLLLFILFLYGAQKCSAHREGEQRIPTGLLQILPQNSSDIYRTRSWATPGASSGRRKSYLASRFLYTSNDTRTQQLSRIILGGDIHKKTLVLRKREPQNILARSVVRVRKSLRLQQGQNV